MPYQPTARAVLFNDGPGFLLLSALTHGQKAQSYLVRSVPSSLSLSTSTDPASSPQFLVRKKLHQDYTNLIPHSDIRFASLIHPSIAPPLLYHQEYENVSDALYFAFCNGGDLRGFIEAHTSRGLQIPEAFIWHWLSTTLKHLACLHYPVDFRSSVDPLIHRDVWQGNFFLHWSIDASIPEIQLGDFGAAQYVSQGNIGRGPTSIGNDIYSVAFVLLVMLLGKPLCFASAKGANVTLDEVSDLLPTEYSDELRSVAILLSKYVIGTRFRVSDVLVQNWDQEGVDTLTLARALLPLAEDMLARLELPDLTWTKPVITTTPAYFRDEKEVSEWCSTSNQGMELSGRWELVDVQKDTGRVLRRSERLKGGRVSKRGGSEKGTRRYVK